MKAFGITLVCGASIVTQAATYIVRPWMASPVVKGGVHSSNTGDLA